MEWNSLKGARGGSCRINAEITTINEANYETCQELKTIDICAAYTLTVSPLHFYINFAPGHAADINIQIKGNLI